MKEQFPGVMDMAVNTFLKITTVCKNEFVFVNQRLGKAEEKVPFVQDILRNMEDYIRDLDEKDTLIFYEAMGNIISAEKNQTLA